MAANSSPSSALPSSISKSTSDLNKEIRTHEIAIAELANLASSRTVYQKNGNIYFRTNVQKATTFEQRQLDATKAKLQKLTP